MKTNFISLFAFLIWMNSLYSQSINGDNRHLQNNAIANSFITSPNDSCYLICNNALYLKLNSKGDSWNKIVGQINTISIDPKNPKIFYAIDDKNKIYKSMDGGKHWIMIQNGLPPIKFNKLLINPHNNEEVFLSSPYGIYKTSDAGFTWQLLCAGIDLSQLIINSIDKSKFYALLSQGIIGLSTDAGFTWKNISNTLPKKLVKGVGRTAQYSTIIVNRILDINYPNSQFLLAFTEKGIYKTTDDGKTWNELNIGFSPNAIVTSAFFTNDEIFLGCGVMNKTTGILEPRIFKSDIFATKWQNIEIKSDITGMITGIYKEKEHPGIFIEANNKIAYIDTSLNVIGLNYGVTCHSIMKYFTTYKTQNGLVMFAISENRNLCDIDNYGLWRSTNLGKSWSKCILYEPPYNGGGGLRKIFFSPFNPNEIILIDNEYMFISTNGGINWTDGHEKYKYNKISWFSFDHVNPQIRYFINGGTFRYDQNTLQYTNLGNHGNRLLISSDNNRKIITSSQEITTDSGWTWNSFSNNLKLIINFDFNEGANYAIPLIFDNDYILLIARYWNLPTVKSYLVESKDLGATWNILQSYDVNLLNTFIDPNNHNNITIVKRVNIENWIDRNRQDIPKGILMQSIDGGKSWKELLQYTSKEYSSNVVDWDIESYFESIFSLEYSGELYTYICTSSGLIYTYDEGRTWQKIGGINENN